MQPRVILDHSSFTSNFQDLVEGDIVKGRLRLKHGEEHLLHDLISRKIHLIPSAGSQLASRSKTYQARIFSQWMIPETRVIYDAHQVLETVSYYNRKAISQVIVKLERKNAGIGILKYSNIEDVYNQAANNVLPFPFVLQPFIANCADIRVIIIGSYIEAYSRQNHHSFRNNLHCGGKSAPYTLSEKELQLCRNVMERGLFPYGHLDLMRCSEDNIYLAEINLRGGLRGAAISTEEYKKRVAQIDDKLFEDLIEK